MTTTDELHRIMPHCKPARISEFIQSLNSAMNEFGISTPERQAAFLAQVAHESGELRYTEEIASGKAYEGRADLGNIFPGDGVKYKGRGLLQITGRDNYKSVGKALGLPLIDHPEMLATVGPACRSAGWFWQTRKLNELADQGLTLQITKKINGGVNGLQDRIAYYKTAMEVLA